MFGWLRGILYLFFLNPEIVGEEGIHYKTDFPLKNIKFINISILLSQCHSNILKEYRILQLKSNLYKAVEEQVNGETDFKIKYVTPFISSPFILHDKFQVYWDAQLDCYNCSDMSILRRQTPDAKFVEIGGVEIGAVEVKPFNTSTVDIDNDTVRLGEITKRMLHQRVLKAKSLREYMTFGTMVYGSVVEYYIHMYHPPITSSTATAQSSSRAAAATETAQSQPSYELKLIKKKRTLPTLASTYTYMMLSLEYLVYFKKLMEESLTQDTDIHKPYMHNSPDDCVFKPTVTLLKLE
ncbi:hypothetical protein BD770DRAFT_408206 [Pilaira anomala]|nr:hypothetical protein BD770DRAFT_408206 [Pilaira anomala]